MTESIDRRRFLKVLGVTGAGAAAVSACGIGPEPIDCLGRERDQPAIGEGPCGHGHRGRPPRNEGEQYPADPPTVEEIVAVMRMIGDRPEGRRLLERGRRLQ